MRSFFIIVLIVASLAGCSISHESEVIPKPRYTKTQPCPAKWSELSASSQMMIDLGLGNHLCQDVD
ncbi:hypothetical protein KC845_03480, partial [Candidatus Kaiserbacteria bacterium]|nr:hypothetical protein [Candidatus Kaiserbacteria bacterium]